MTQVKPRTKPVWHETPAIAERRALCVAESPAGLLLRLKGCRQVLTLPWPAAYLRAAELLAASRVTRRRKSVRRAALR